MEHVQSRRPESVEDWLAPTAEADRHEPLRNAPDSLGRCGGCGIDEEEPVHVRLLCFDGCPNWETTCRQLETLSAELETAARSAHRGRRTVGLPRLADGAGVADKDDPEDTVGVC